MTQRECGHRNVSLASMLLANSIAVLIAFVLCLGLFSLLPLSTLAVLLPINFFTFAFFHDRMSNRQYFCFVLSLSLGTLTLLMLAISIFGRRPFDFLLG